MVLRTIPPQGLVLIAIVAIQLGSALATFLFPVIGAEGTVAIRIIFAATLLGIAARGTAKNFVRQFSDNWLLLLVFGFCIAAMNMFFFKSIARIPLGAAVAFEFIGPLGVAAFNSRRPRHFACVGLAAVGILLLSPLSGANLDPLGIVFALLAGFSWGLFIILTGRVHKQVNGNDGLAIGMGVAAIVMIPFAAPVVGDLVAAPLILLAGLGVALLSTTIPFTLEFEALKRLSARAYGVLVSVEPAVAAIIGAVILGERIGIRGGVAVACVVVAAIGISLTDDSNA